MKSAKIKHYNSLCGQDRRRTSFMAGHRIHGLTVKSRCARLKSNAVPTDTKPPKILKLLSVKDQKREGMKRRSADRDRKHDISDNFSDDCCTKSAELFMPQTMPQISVNGCANELNSRQQFYKICQQILHSGRLRKTAAFTSGENISQAQFRALLWLEIKANLANCPLETLDRCIYAERERLCKMFTDIAEFSFLVGSSSCDIFSGDYFMLQEKALSAVESLLSNFGELEELFPSSRVMIQMYSITSVIPFSFWMRYYSMLAWFNMTILLNQYIKRTGAFLGLFSSELVVWPWSRFSSCAHLLRNNSFISFHSPWDIDGDTEDFQADESCNGDTGTVADAVSDADRYEAHLADAAIRSPRCDSNSCNPCSLFTSRCSVTDSSPDASKLAGEFVVNNFADQLDKFVSKRRYSVAKILNTFQPILGVVLQKVNTLSLDIRKAVEVADAMELQAKRLKPLNRRGSSEEDLSLDYFARQTEALNLPSILPLYQVLVQLFLFTVERCLLLKIQRHIVDPSLSIIPSLLEDDRESILFTLQCIDLADSMLCAIVNCADVTKSQAFIENVKSALCSFLQCHLKYIATLVSITDGFGDYLDVFLVEWKFLKQVLCEFNLNFQYAQVAVFCRTANLLCSQFFSNAQSTISAKLSDCLANFASLPNSVTLIKPMKQNIKALKIIFREQVRGAIKLMSLAKHILIDCQHSALFTFATIRTEFVGKLLCSGYRFLHLLNGDDSLLIAYQSEVEGDINSCPLHGLRAANVRTDIRHLFIFTYDQLVRDELSSLFAELPAHPHVATCLPLISITSSQVLLIVSGHENFLTQRTEIEARFNMIRLLVGRVVWNPELSCEIQAIQDCLRQFCHFLTETLSQFENGFVSNFPQQAVDWADEKNLLRLEEITIFSLQSMYNQAFEYLRDVWHVLSGELRMKLSQTLRWIARLWMDFVLSSSEKERMHRSNPSWAYVGLHFLVFCLHPDAVSNLSDADYYDFRNKVNECFQHLTGRALPLEDKSATPIEPPLQLVSCVWPHFAVKSRRILSKNDRDLRKSRSPASERVSPPMLEQASTSMNSVHNSFSRLTSMFLQQLSLQSESSCTDGQLEMIRAKLVQHRRQREEAVLKVDEGMDGKRQSCVGHEVMECGDNPAEQVPAVLPKRRVHFKWVLGRLIGKGTFGSVYQAYNIDAKVTLALKMVHYRPSDVQAVREIMDEILSLEQLEPHTNIIKYYGVEVHSDCLFIFMEHCDYGTLADLSRLGTLDIYAIKSYTIQLLQAVEHIHGKKILHRDIKGSNLFLTLDQQLKLGDFGCAVRINEFQTFSKDMRGTYDYLAPEILNADEFKCRTNESMFASDIWSVGCVVLEMFTGRRPWYHISNEHSLILKIGLGNHPPIPERVERDQEALRLLERCFVPNPNERSSATVLLNAPFLQGVFS